MNGIFAGLLVTLSAQAAGQTICIDPGHPSEISRGTAGRHVTEIQAAWRVATRLAERLRRDGLAVILTKKSENEFVTNRRRAQIANQAQAALMLRLHCDAGSGSGYAVYYPAATGNVKGMTGPSEAVISASRDAATRIHRAMHAALAGTLPDEGLKTDRETAVGHRLGALTASIFSRVPVVLVEMVVLQNPRDEAWIASREGEGKMVEALFAGVMSCVGRRIR